jgi:hypothetical protein
MARTAREYHSDDTKPRALEPIVEASDLEGQVIVTDEKALTDTDYFKELAFMREKVTVVLNKGRERKAPMYEQFGVNGKIIWIQVNTPTVIERSYLEVMARSQPISIRTESGEVPDDALTQNIVHRDQRANFSFSVIEDKNPKGAAWLQKIIRES